MDLWRVHSVCWWPNLRHLLILEMGKIKMYTGDVLGEGNKPNRFHAEPW